MGCTTKLWWQIKPTRCIHNLLIFISHAHRVSQGSEILWYLSSGSSWDNRYRTNVYISLGINKYINADLEYIMKGTISPEKLCSTATMPTNKSVGRIYYQIFITFKWDELELTWYSANSIAIVFKVLSAGWSNLWASWNPVGKNVQFKTTPLKSSLEQINTIISLQIIVVLHIMNKQKETRWKTKWKVHILIKKIK